MRRGHSERLTRLWLVLRTDVPGAASFAVDTAVANRSRSVPDLAALNPDVMLRARSPYRLVRASFAKSPTTGTAETALMAASLKCCFRSFWLREARPRPKDTLALTISVMPD
ncbi:MAG: hypothetical protein KDA52_05220 [Planctomycetaceae bacterium]|nr:hypothetical protein [Planctomycetaceae bacterium]